MTSYTPAGKEVADQLLVGQGNRKNLGIERLCNELGELRAKVEALEGKYETMRLATLEWGKDVETLKLRSDRHLQRIEALESAENYRQQDEDAERAHESSQSGSLVERVGAAIFEQFENNAGNEEEARAAIRQVANWLRNEHFYGVCALLLEQEIGDARSLF